MIRTRKDLLTEVSSATITNRCQRGEYTRLLPGIYSIGAPSAYAKCQAVTAWLPEAVFSHRTAAWLWNMLPEPAPIEATTPLSIYRQTPSWLHLYRRDLLPDWIDEAWDLPATTPARSLLDCLTVLPQHDADRLIDEHARTSWPQLLELRTHLRGSPALRRQLRTAAFDAASDPERLFARALAHRGVHLLANHPVGPYYADFADTRSHTIIEIDGREFHSDPRTFRTDRRRQNALVLAGWLVLRYAAADIYANLDACADEAATVIRRRRHNRPPH
ncbi:DUF559 domain-containing protein [Nocardia sp. NBC_01388]|uniref:DUF559 domain-containing protein n=1 Tax=Nocardia sp. NBC_01388 TaxID=2903596 RepID=UPI00324B2DD2